MLETLEYLATTDVWFELTTLLIPGMNDSNDELDRMTTWVVDHLGPDVPMHFTAFHPDYRMLDREPTPPATLTRARHDRDGERCPHTPTPATCVTATEAAPTVTVAVSGSSSATAT